MFRFLLIFLIFFTHSAYATDSYSDKIITDSQAKIFEDTKKGAKQGDTVAQYNLGASYDKGEGVTEDDAEAVRWYRKAAEQGHAKAQFNLGVMYTKGEGVPEDYVQAYAWLSIAAAQGHEKAKKTKEIFADVMTNAQFAKARKLSRKFWEAYGPGR